MHHNSGSSLAAQTRKKVQVKSLVHVRLFGTPWAVAYQAPPSTGFSRQEYWSEMPFPSLQTVKNLPAVRETQVRPLGSDDPPEKEMATHSSILPGEFHGQRSQAGYRTWGQKELDITE